MFSGSDNTSFLKFTKYLLSPRGSTCKPSESISLKSEDYGRKLIEMMKVIIFYSLEVKEDIKRELL